MEKINYVQGFNWLGIYQLIGGILGVYYLSVFTLQVQEFTSTLLVLIGLGFIMFLFSVYCGISIFKKETNSLKCSLINQYLQLFVISGPGIAFQYVAGVSVLFGFNITDQFRIYLDASLSAWSISIGTNMSDRLIAVNLIAIGLVFLLHYILNDINREKVRDLVNSIGS
ncbi:hypothetical protein [Flavitalea sp.]|nr:hypothetical protein [Flavitalea sp.]